MRYGLPSTVESQERGVLHAHALLFTGASMQSAQSDPQRSAEESSEDREDGDVLH